MYLKALEIQGFKSFPDKTRIVFEKNVTAIVGPNGSGKSNISDAILWVMGEQRTRTLRGSKMEDVIFGGTEKRAALGFAQVSLVIDNSGRIFNIENSELVITRRYYRSGESEYYINRESVRLKDITELLMDTGLGRDGYSVIGQGRIGEIVSARSIDRRDIFEEAAGISRFRYRKEEAERKLARADENLVRIRDKIDELELQVGPLREQSETARRFLTLRDELRVLEVSVWLENLDRLRASSASVENSYAAAKAELETAHAQLEALYAQAENISRKMRETDLEAERARALLSETEAAAAECESAGAVLRTMRGANRESLERMRRELLEAKDKADTLGARVAENRERIAEIDAQRAALDADIRGVLRRAEESDRETDGKLRELNGLISKENALQDELTQGRTMLTVLADASEELERRGLDNKAAENQTGERLSMAQAEHKEARKKLSESKQRCDELSNVIAGYKMRMSGREEKARELSGRLTGLTIETNSMDSRIAMLTELEKDFEGFSKAVKTVMQEHRHGALKGVHGPVASLVKAGDRYALAIETALGAAMQNIVVDTQDDGRQAIELLKRRDAGRATFLPLNVIRGNTLQKPPSGEEGFLGLALDLAQFDSAYREIFSSILGRTIVVETLSDAVRISRKNDNRLRIVTLDGQLVSAGGSMTGGSAARNTGIISRANELKRLREQRESLRTREAAVKAELAEAERELAASRYELEVSRSESERAREELSIAESGEARARMLVSSLEEALDALEAERTEILAKTRENAEKTAAVGDEAERVEAALKSLRGRMESLSRGREEIRHRKDALTQELSELRERGASLVAERGATQAAAGQLEALIGEMSTDSEARRRAIDELEARNRDLEDELAVKEARLAELAAGVEAARERIAGMTAQKLELEGLRTGCEKSAQEKNRELIDMERVCAGLEQKRLAADMEEKQLVDRLWDTYELSHSAAAEVRREIESISRATRRVGELKREISSLGSVNLGAIEEYERVRTRYDFLTEQRDDVIKAKADLSKIISDITREMKEIFIREFRAIDECFRTTFLELFGGGKAQLVLEDENDVLNCGIDIKVQPPGKALSTISLMSGGEMAFVAIALYFAILKTRPTPFCVMDEIEAALDENNVIRFAEYMCGMSDSIQFIVITHRRSTMEEADMLYGVTMQEKGVSRIISVDLEEAEKTIA